MSYYGLSATSLTPGAGAGFYDYIFATDGNS